MNHWFHRNVEDVCQMHQKDRFTCPRTYSYFMSTIMWGVASSNQGSYRVLTFTIPPGVISPNRMLYRQTDPTLYGATSTPRGTNELDALQLELHARHSSPSPRPQLLRKAS